MEYAVFFTPKSIEHIEKQGVTKTDLEKIDVAVSRHFLECGSDISDFHDLVKQHKPDNVMLVAEENDEKDIIEAAQVCAVEIVLANRFIKGPYHAWTLGY